MARPTTDTSISYMEFGHEGTDSEHITVLPSPSSRPDGQETPRERDIGSVGSIHFQLDHLAQLSSTQAETVGDTVADSPRSVRQQSSAPTSPETLEESNDALKAALLNDTMPTMQTLLMKIYEKLETTNKQLTSKMEATNKQLTKMETNSEQLTTNVTSIEETMKVQAGTLVSMEARLDAKLGLQSIEIKEVAKQLDDTTVNLNKRLDLIPGAIKAEVDLLRAEVRAELTTQVSEFKVSVEEQIKNQTEVMEEQLNKKFKESIEIQRADCDRRYDRLEKKLSTTKQQLETTVAEISDKVDKTAESQNTIHAQVNSIADQHVQLEKRCTTIEEEIKTQKLDRTKLNEEMHAVSTKITSGLEHTNTRISQLETKLTYARNNGEINTVPEMQSISHLFHGLGKFSNTNQNMQPKPFIDQLRVIQDLVPTPWPVWRFKLSALLIGEPLLFLHGRAHEFTTLENFIKAFLEQYWSIDRQQGLLSEIISCQYNNKNGQTCTAFVAKIRYMNSQLDNPIPDLTLASIAVKKLPYHIQLALATSPVKSFRDLENYLHCIQAVTGNHHQHNSDKQIEKIIQYNPPPINIEESYNKTIDSTQEIETHSPPPNNNYSNRNGFRRNQFNNNRGRNNHFQHRSSYFDGRDRLERAENTSTPKPAAPHVPSSNSSAHATNKSVPTPSTSAPNNTNNSRQGTQQNKSGNSNNRM